MQLPARPEFGRVIRVGGAAVALRQGFSFQEIDELRLAIDETIILLLDGVAPQDNIVATFRFRPEHLELEVSTTNPGSYQGEAVARFSELTTPLLSRAEIDSDQGRIVIEKTSAVSATA